MSEQSPHPVESSPSVTPASAGDQTTAGAPRRNLWTYFWIAYVVIAIGFALYGTFNGETQARGFSYNLGRGLVWPFTAFPALGQIVGGILALALVIWLLSSNNDKSSN